MLHMMHKVKHTSLQVVYKNVNISPTALQIGRLGLVLSCRFHYFYFPVFLVVVTRWFLVFPFPFIPYP